MVIENTNKRMRVDVKDMRELLSPHKFRHFKRVSNRMQSLYFSIIEFQDTTCIMLTPVHAPHLEHCYVSNKKFILKNHLSDGMYSINPDNISFLSPCAISIPLLSYGKTKTV